MISDIPAFIRANTSVLSPPLVPELRLHLADAAVALWVKTEEELGTIGLPPPFWAFAWAGGQALARYVLDMPSVVRNKTVLDLATGSGLVAIAAAKAGAATVLAADIDAFAATACKLNMALNGVALEILWRDLLECPPASFEIILVGDLFYQQSTAERAFTWLRQAAAQGAHILIGDPGRSYLPRQQLHMIAEFSVPVTRELEDAEIKKTAVWRLDDHALTKASEPAGPQYVKIHRD